MDSATKTTTKKKAPSRRPSEAAEWANIVTPPTALPPLLEGCAFHSDELAAAVAEIEAATLEAHALGCIHTAAEIDGDPGEAAAEDIWQSANDRATKLAVALLERAPRSEPERLAVATVYLRYLNLYATRTCDWKQTAPVESIKRLMDAMPDFGFDLAPLVDYLMLPLATGGDEAWDAAWAAYRASREAYAAAGRRFDEAWATMQAEAPMPTVLNDPAGGYYASEGEIKKADELSFEQKVEKLAALAQIKPVRAEARERLRIDALSEEQDQLWEPVRATREILMSMTPATPARLAQKIAMLVAEIADRDDEDAGPLDLNKPLDVQELQAQSWCSLGPVLLGLYRDALRMAGQDAPALHVAPFDVAAWIETFEAIPGHSITSSGPRYEDLIAWGVTQAPMISDADALDRHDAYVAARFAEFGKHPGEHEIRNGRPFYIGAESHITAAYPEDDPRRAEKLAEWEAYLAKRRGPPLGDELWSDLTRWQKNKIKHFCHYVRDPQRVAARTAELEAQS